MKVGPSGSAGFGGGGGSFSQRSWRSSFSKPDKAESTKKEIEHKEKIAGSDFETQYQESTYLPLGEEPALLFSVGIKSNPNGQPWMGLC